jgi:hypothetical protein
MISRGVCLRTARNEPVGLTWTAKLLQTLENRLQTSLSEDCSSSFAILQSLFAHA